MKPDLHLLNLKIGVLFDSFPATKNCPPAELEYMVACVMSEVEDFLKQQNKRGKR